MTHATTKAQEHAGGVRTNVARVGLVGMGLLYALLGLLAINVATGDRATATRAGAVQAVAQAPLGRFLLIGLTVALVALVIWKITQAIAGDPVEGSEATDRIKYVVKALLFGTAALSAIAILIANWGISAPVSGSGSGANQQQATAVVMGFPGGRWIVMAVGLAAIGLGCYQIFRNTVKCEFMERLHVSGDRERVVTAVGRLGYAGSGAVTIGVGVFLFLAGVRYDPDNVKGLSGLLAELSGNGWGQLALWLIALGLLAYGLFALAEARYRRAT